MNIAVCKTAADTDMLSQHLILAICKTNETAVMDQKAVPLEFVDVVIKIVYCKYV